MSTWPNSWPAPHTEQRALEGVHRYAWSAPSAPVETVPPRSAGATHRGGVRWHMQLHVAGTGDVELSGTIGSPRALNSANAWNYDPNQYSREA